MTCEKEWNCFYRPLWFLLVLGMSLVPVVVLAENIDPADDGSQFAWGENIGWLNAEPDGEGGQGIVVEDDGLSGYLWSENAGWVNLSCVNNARCGTRDYRVTNDGAGNLAGYAWSENAGWISFSCTNKGSCATKNYGVIINPTTGEFSGRAWSENLGWMSFRDSTGGGSYGVITSWAPFATETDGDGIADVVDNLPATFSNNFSDAGLGGTTTGTINARGDQEVIVQEEANPAGVRITTNSPGGVAPATITVCGGIARLTMDHGDALVATCTNVVEMTIVSGEVGVEYDLGDTSATVDLGAGNTLTFDPATNVFTAPATNPDSLVIVVGEEEHVLPPGQTVVVETSVSAISDLLVGSFFTNEILRYDGQTGDFITVFAQAAVLEQPAGVTFGSDGHVYVAGLFHSNVVRFHGQTGAFIDEFVGPGSGGLVAPQAVLFGPDGNLYVGSQGTSEVLRYDGTTGAFMDVFVDGTVLRQPTGLIFGPDGNLYVSSFRSDEILRYDGTTGAFIDSFVTGFSLRFPVGLRFGPDGNLYVGNNGNNPTDDGGSVVRFHGQTGAFIDEFVPEGSGGLSGVTDMSFGPDRNLYVSAFFGSGAAQTGEVFRYDGTTGAFLDLFVTEGSGGLNGSGLLAFFPIPGPAPSELWSRQDGTPGTDSATAVAVGDGLYVAGVTTGTLDGQTSAGGQDSFLRKYDLAGTLLCTEQFGSAGNETVTGIKVTDSAVYVNGDTTGTLPGNTSSGGTDLYVRQYDLNCLAGWTTQFGTAGDDTAASGLGLTPDGTSLFVGGTTDNGLGGDTDALIQRLDTNGTLQCANQFGTPGDELGGVVVNSPRVSMAVTTDGGSFGGSDGLMSQFDLNCLETWSTPLGTAAGDETVSGIGVGPSDSDPDAVFVGSDTTASYPGTSNTGGSDLVLQRYNFTTGQLQWTRQFGTSGREVGGVVVNSPFVWMGGTTTGTFPGFNNSGGTDIVIRKFELDGSEVYTTQFGTDQDDQILAMTHTADATSIFVVGNTLGAFPGTTNQGGQDFFVKRLEVTSDPIVLLHALIDLVKGAETRHRDQRRLLRKLKVALHSLEHLQDGMEPSYRHSGRGHDHGRPNHHRAPWWRCGHHQSTRAGCHNHDDVTIAKKALAGFIKIVERKRGKKIPEVDAERFIADAQKILDSLKGS